MSSWHPRWPKAPIVKIRSQRPKAKPPNPKIEVAVPKAESARQAPADQPFGIGSGTAGRICDQSPGMLRKGSRPRHQNVRVVRFNPAMKGRLAASHVMPGKHEMLRMHRPGLFFVSEESLMRRL